MTDQEKIAALMKERDEAWTRVEDLEHAVVTAMKASDARSVLLNEACATVSALTRKLEEAKGARKAIERQAKSVAADIAAHKRNTKVDERYAYLRGLSAGLTTALGEFKRREPMQLVGSASLASKQSEKPEAVETGEPVAYRVRSRAITSAGWFFVALEHAAHYLGSSMHDVQPLYASPVSDGEARRKALDANEPFEQPDFIYFECRECQFSSVQPQDFKGSRYCPICAEDNGRDVQMSSRVCRSTDKPEGKDARALAAPTAGDAK